MPDPTGARCRATTWPACLTGAAWLLVVPLLVSPAGAQVGTLASPGPLSRAHARFEGLGGCQKCHSPGQQVTASKCLACHAPIGDRIARRVGVHRNVTGECAACHVEHGGADVDLRHIDAARFDHAAETGFPIDGRHARLAQTCSACHKTRSFLTARAACHTCHADPHKTSLGKDCARCHTTAAPFTAARTSFDHTKARFVLSGAHRAVDCAKCHAGGVFRGLRFDTCASCHKTPHREQLGPACTTCHTTERWATRTIDHARTGFPLAGRHGQLACEKCHGSDLTRPLRFDGCSSCHVKAHRESIAGDCRECHSEQTFKGARFDHAAKTRFPLAGRHAGLPCRACHTTLSAEGVPVAEKVLDFGGTRAECAACHKDAHEGRFGRACDACHRSLTFKTAGFTHPRLPGFFAGRHAGIACERCHVPAAGPGAARAMLRTAPAGGKPPATTCDTCHLDVHLGQVGAACERCHTVAAERFAPAAFTHAAAAFALTGAHTRVECAKCHAVQDATFPAGTGTARRLKPVSSECRACHGDPHLGQVAPMCATCHSTESFALLAYVHRGLDDVFAVGSHGRLPCRGCHRRETTDFPAGRGTAVRLAGLGRTCLGCHP